MDGIQTILLPQTLLFAPPNFGSGVVWEAEKERAENFSGIIRDEGREG